MTFLQKRQRNSDKDSKERSASLGRGSDVPLHAVRVAFELFCVKGTRDMAGAGRAVSWPLSF